VVPKLYLHQHHVPWTQASFLHLTLMTLGATGTNPTILMIIDVKLDLVLHRVFLLQLQLPGHLWAQSPIV
jgi:hypothetical protein